MKCVYTSHNYVTEEATFFTLSALSIFFNRPSQTCVATTKAG
jgi:hypothetical protein